MSEEQIIVGGANWLTNLLAKLKLIRLKVYFYPEEKEWDGTYISCTNIPAKYVYGKPRRKK